MDYITTVISIGLAILFILIGSGACWRNWHNPLVRNSWLFTVFFALGLLFRIEGFYTAFNAWLGINNLAWFMSRVLLTLSVYTISWILLRGIGNRQVGWLTPLTVIVLSFYLLAYLAYFVRIPEQFFTGAVDSVDFPAFLTRTVMLVHAAMVIILPAPHLWRVFRDEKNRLAKIRWGILLFAIIDAEILFLTKTIFYLAAFYDLLGPASLGFLAIGVDITQALTLVWLPSVLLERAYKVWLRLKADWVKVDRLRNLLYLSRCLAAFTPAVPTYINRWTALSQLDIACHQAFIAVLDMESRVQNLSGGASQLRQIMDRWRAKGNTTHFDLDLADYEAQLDAYATMGRHLRQQKFIQSHKHQLTSTQTYEPG